MLTLIKAGHGRGNNWVTIAEILLTIFQTSPARLSPEHFNKLSALAASNSFARYLLAQCHMSANIQCDIKNQREGFRLMHQAADGEEVMATYALARYYQALTRNSPLSMQMSQTVTTVYWLERTAALDSAYLPALHAFREQLLPMSLCLNIYMKLVNEYRLSVIQPFPALAASQVPNLLEANKAHAHYFQEVLRHIKYTKFTSIGLCMSYLVQLVKSNWPGVAKLTCDYINGLANARKNVPFVQVVDELLQANRCFPALFLSFLHVQLRHVWKQRQHSDDHQLSHLFLAVYYAWVANANSSAVTIKIQGYLSTLLPDGTDNFSDLESNQPLQKLLTAIVAIIDAYSLPLVNPWKKRKALPALTVLCINTVVPARRPAWLQKSLSSAVSTFFVDSRQGDCSSLDRVLSGDSSGCQSVDSDEEGKTTFLGCFLAMGRGICP